MRAAVETTNWLLTRAATPAVGGALLLLAGCASTEDPPRAADAGAMAPPAAFVAAHLHGPAIQPWGETFASPELDALVREATANNPDLRLAAARVDEARAVADRAAAALSPVLDAALLPAWSDPGRGRDTAVRSFVGVTGAWEIDVWGRLRTSRNAAVASARAAAADETYARYAVGAQVARVWFQLIAAAEQVQISTDLVAVRERTQRVMKARQEAGAAQGMDLRIADADVESAKSQLAADEASLRETARALELLLGRYPGSELAAPARLPPLPSPAPPGVPSELLERRPDLIAADCALAAAFFRLESARTARLPTLSLTGEFGIASQELKDVLNPSDVAWNLGANLFGPLIDGGRREADVRIAGAQQEQAVAAYVSTAQRAFAEVESALTAETWLRTRQASLAKAEETLRLARDNAELRYREGLMSILDLTQVEARLFGARSDLLAVTLALFVQRVNLHQALGGSFGPAVERPGPSNPTPVTFLGTP